MADDGDHARHDPLLAAAATDRGASLPMNMRSCRGCVDLHADLLGIVAAVPMAAMPRRPRDLRLTAIAAARLRAPGWRRLLDAFGSARDEVSRPLAVGFATLGVAGLILTAIPTVLPTAGAAGSTAGDAAYHPLEAEPASASAAPTVAKNGAAPAERVPIDTREILVPPGPSPLVLVSGAFLGAGGILFAARAFATRRGPVR